MKHKGENLETHTSPEDGPRDGDKMLLDPLLNKAVLQPSNGLNTNKELKIQGERLSFSR